MKGVFLNESNDHFQQPNATAGILTICSCNMSCANKVCLSWNRSE